MTGQKKTRNWFSRINGNTKQLLVICLIIFAVFSIMQPTRFPTLRNLESMCFQFPEPGLFTLGIGITMLTAGADLSIVAVGNLVATLCGMLLLQKMPQDAGSSVELMYVLLCFVIAVGVGLLCGCLNGLLVAKLGIFPILATLGTQNLFTGISSALTKGQGVFGTFPEALIYLGSGKLFG
ncbi:MAG TPA: ABC transporter permease, partial [Candidatus Pullichristensenella stercorigallinarum]|nr:ABC transporter permease [Candidatus Pullichristensenella stercorigallinarum]